jgi:lipoyl(octanoyl) transferase
MRLIDLGIMPYKEAWAFQEKIHGEVALGWQEALILVQHPPVITLGRRGDTGGNILRTEEQLRELNIEFVHSDRGGDVTFHGPGQIVAYPVVRLADHKLSVGGYVHKLEAIVIAALAEMGISAFTDPTAVGVWVNSPLGPAKICAIGVRIRRGASLHGLALNVEGELEGFLHIIACGLKGRNITSVQRILGAKALATEAVKQILARHILDAFAD